MNIILLSGGSGKRLWPLSNDIRSKQFIPVFKDEEGNFESMVQRVYRYIKKVDGDANVVIATSKSQVSELKNQLGNDINISIEPERRDTFPAIALASYYMYENMNVNRDESVIVCPVDPYVEEDYFSAFKKLDELVKENKSNLTLLGINPTSPSDKYGYIIPETNDEVAKVSTFKEKPSVEVAKEYLKQHALWNGGIFAFKLGYLLDKTKEVISMDNYDDIYSSYETIKKISFDYAVVEHEKSIQVLRFSGIWDDLGSWESFSKVIPHSIGNVHEENCKNIKSFNYLDIPLVTVGLNDAIVACSQDGILVSDSSLSSTIKPIVEKIIDAKIRYAEKSWGTYNVIHVSEHETTIAIHLNSGCKMSYHSHKYRNEIWTITSGEGYTIVDGMKQNVHAGDVITMDKGCRHTIIATTDMELIEVQIGEVLDVKDKIKYEL